MERTVALGLRCGHRRATKCALAARGAAIAREMRAFFRSFTVALRSGRQARYDPAVH
jgi:hypothetical protein